MTQFTAIDPRNFDGDCFEVAEKALRQSAAIARVLAASLKGARSMALNAELERQLQATEECHVAAFEASAQARRIDAAREQAEAMEKSLNALAVAAGYNPRKPVKA